MTFASPYFVVPQALNLPKLQRVILQRADHGTVRYHSYGSPEITAQLESVARAVESAYILTAKDELPKVQRVDKGGHLHTFRFENLNQAPISATAAINAESARNVASKWLAVAAYLEREEKTKADEAKKAETARTNRLNALASEYFTVDFFSELNVRKARVIEELYRLERELELADEESAA